MKQEWLNKRNNTDLIVFFSGWGDGNISVKPCCENYDVLMFFDYRTFDEINIDFSQYKNKYLIGWSMGVYVCNYYYDKFNDFNKLIAINGTQKPNDDNFGIPTFIYDLTIRNFNELSCNKFVKKMSPSLAPDKYSTHSIEELRNELISIKNLEIKELLKFDKAIISLKDKIFPPQNQMNWWKTQNVKMEISENSFHYIFDIYKKWSDLI